MIYRREEFFEEQPDDQKFPVRQVEQITSLDGSVKKYVGRVTLGIQTPMGVTSLPVSFEIEAASVQEAFTKFSKRAETEVEAAQNEFRDRAHRDAPPQPEPYRHARRSAPDGPRQAEAVSS